MWIFLRLMLAIIGLAIRQFGRRRTPKDRREFRGTPYYSTIHTAKGAVKGFEIAMERTTPTWIRLHAESTTDRVFKMIGVANELQTGDAEFDQKVYVTCDHPHVAEVLTQSAELRAAIVAMLDAGYRKIFFDGTRVRAERKSDYTPTDHDLELLKAVWEASWKLSDAPPSRLGDRFLWKALLVESVIWGIAGYAIGAAIEFSVNREDHHLSERALWSTGLVAAAIAFGVLVLLIALWMRGSSRGHRVIVESALVLLVGLPIASVQFVSDTNRSFDDAPAQITERTFSECEIREHHSRRRRRSYSYHLHLMSESGGSKLPGEVQVTRELCTAAQGSTDNAVTIAVGEGRWGVPWYRWIRIGETTWKNPL